MMVIVARRLFENPQKVSEITGLDKILVNNFSVILQVISSGQQVNHIKFGNYCLKTAERYISLYKWYYMPSSVHKLLLHGAEIIQHAYWPTFRRSAGGTKQGLQKLQRVKFT